MRPWASARAVSAICITGMLFTLSPAARGQEQPTTAAAPGDDAAWRQQMDARMRQLEQENAQLRSKVGDVAETQQAVMKDAQERGLLTMESGQPRLTTPDFFDLNKFSAEGDFPGSVRIAGTKTSFQIGGYVQLDAIFDTDRIDNDDGFVVNSIPTGGDHTGAGNTNFSVRQSRLFLKTQTPTEHAGQLITYIEMDLMGADGTEPRLRHAYGQVGDKYQFLAGQTWTAFQDATIFPSTLDAQGPAGIVTSRRPQVRFTRKFNPAWTGVVSLEDPNSDITVPAGFAGVKATPYPDLAGNVRWSPEWGHVQVSGVVRYLQFDPDVDPRESTWGYGLNLTGSVKTIKLDEKHVDSVLYQVAGGTGLGRYVNDTGGLGLDGVIIAPGADLDGLPLLATMVAYQHWWNAKWGSTLGYSFVTVDNVAGMAGSDYHSGHYGVLNLRYYPAERVMVGGEVLYGLREDNDGSTGDDVRFQFSIQYKF